MQSKETLETVPVRDDGGLDQSRSGEVVKAVGFCIPLEGRDNRISS